ncbi:hypothetical protein Tco_1035819, partial [Tanacetum coccineum]
MKTAGTPMEPQKPLTKDENGSDVDVHLYRSMIGSLMYLTSSKPDIMLAGQPILGLLYPKDSPLELIAYSDSDYAGASIDRKSITGGCQFLGCRLVSWQCKKQTIMAKSTTEAEYIPASNCYCYEKRLIEMVKIHTDYNVADLLTKAFDVTRFKFLISSIGTSLQYALTHNPTVYDSLVKQFWQTATVRTLANGTQQIEASIDNKSYTIIEASVRSKLQFADATGISNLPDAEIYVGLTTLGFLQMVLEITTSNTGKYLPKILTKKIFANIRRGYAGDYVPLLPVMMAGAAQVQGLDSGNIHESPLMSHEIPSQEGYTSRSVEDNVKLQELMVLVPKLESKIGSLEKELKDTKQTFRKAILTLVDRVKTLEVALKRKTKKVVLSDSKNEETEAQGRKIKELDDDPLVSLVKGFVTPSKTTVSASNEEQIKDISPTTLEAAKTLSKVASQKPKSVDKGRRYKRRKESKGKDI